MYTSRRTAALGLFSLCSLIVLSPSWTQICEELVQGLPALDNVSECDVVVPVKQFTSIRTYYGAYQVICTLATSTCFAIKANENPLDPKNLPVVNTNGYKCVCIRFDKITTNTTNVFNVLSDNMTVLHTRETSIEIQDLEFGYEVGCDDITFFLHYIPGFVYSFELVCDGITKMYPNLTTGFPSIEPLENQASCNVSLNGTRENGGIESEPRTVPLFLDPSLCIEDKQLDGQWEQSSVKLIYLLKLSCDCATKRPTVIHINTGYGNLTKTSYVEHNSKLSVCVHGDGNVTSISPPSDAEIKVVVHVHVQILGSPPVVIASAKACNPAGCTNDTTKTIGTANVTPSQTESKSFAPTSIALTYSVSTTPNCTVPTPLCTQDPVTPEPSRSSTYEGIPGPTVTPSDSNGPSVTEEEEPDQTVVIGIAIAILFVAVIVVFIIGCVVVYKWYNKRRKNNAEDSTGGGCDLTQFNRSNGNGKTVPEQPNGGADQTSAPTCMSKPTQVTETPAQTDTSTTTTVDDKTKLLPEPKQNQSTKHTSPHEGSAAPPVVRTDQPFPGGESEENGCNTVASTGGNETSTRVDDKGILRPLKLPQPSPNVLVPTVNGGTKSDVEPIS